MHDSANSIWNLLLLHFLSSVMTLHDPDATIDNYKQKKQSSPYSSKRA